MFTTIHPIDPLISSWSKNIAETFYSQDYPIVSNDDWSFKSELASELKDQIVSADH
jgi:hypothetical protein